MPAPILRKLVAAKIEAILSEVRALEISEFGWHNVSHKTINGIQTNRLASITLKEGPTILGHPPGANERGVIGGVAAVKGLPVSHSKALIDAVVRYRFPHYSVPVMRLNYPESARRTFHLQHKDLPQESPVFTSEEKLVLDEIFTVRRGWNVLDIGAYLGAGSLSLAEKVGPEGRIVAVEASAENKAVIDAHIELNSCTNLLSVNAAIWHADQDAIELNATERQANAIADDVISSNKKFTVPATTIETQIKKLGGAPDLVSLTVNGAEIMAIDGMKKMDSALLPKRLLAPGWYKKNGVPRSIYLEEQLKALGYQTLVSKGGFVMAWIEGEQMG